MSEKPVWGLLEVLQQVPDPRGRYGRRHPLTAMLAAVICATLCGHQGLQQTVRWLKLHGVEMWHLLGFRRKPPVRQTFANLLAEIDSEHLEHVLLEFVSQITCDPSVLADVSKKPTATTPSSLDTEVWDGKVLRGTRKGDQRAEQVLVRIQAALGTVLGSVQVPLETNETKTALALVRNLVLKGKLIVGDAAYCQRDICETIVDSGGDYLVTVKANQPQLLRDIEQSFVISQSFSPLGS
ncbi:MAG: ISAs1 family transposase [Planctomycetaceae bacterium]